MVFRGFSSIVGFKMERPWGEGLAGKAAHVVAFRRWREKGGSGEAEALFQVPIYLLTVHSVMGHIRG